MSAAALAEADTIANASFTNDGERNEMAQLQSRSKLSDVIDGVVFSRPVQGATAELQQHYRLGSHVVPTVLLNERATSTVTATGDAEMKEETILQVFPSPTAEAMGVRRQQVPVGERNYPVITAPTAGPTGATAIGTGVSDSAVTIAGTNVTPSRYQISATIGRDDLATFMGIEDDVRTTLTAAISDTLDYVALRDSSNGLFSIGTDPTPETTRTTFQSYLAKVYSTIDGRYAPMISDLSLLMNTAVYADAAAQYIANNRGDRSALDCLMEKCRMVMTSAHAPAVDGTGGHADIVVHKGMHVGIVQPIWDGIELIRDEYSLSQDGQVRVTAFVMAGLAAIRTAAYQRVSVDTTS